MTSPILEELARQAAAGDRAASVTLLDQLRAVFRLLDAETLNRVVESAVAFREGVSPGRPATVPLTPELLAWANEDVNEQEIAADLQELRAKGGATLPEMLPELERIVAR